MTITIDAIQILNFIQDHYIISYLMGMIPAGLFIKFYLYVMNLKCDNREDVSTIGIVLLLYPIMVPVLMLILMISSIFRYAYFIGKIIT